MAVIMLVSLVLIAFLVWRGIRPGQAGNSPQSAGQPMSRPKDGRAEFSLTVFLGYIATALLTILFMVATEGMDGLTSGLLIFMWSPMFAVPVFLLAVIAGYPLYRRCTRNTSTLLAIWFGYSIASIIGASLFVLLLMAIGMTEPNKFFLNAMFVCAPALAVAVPSSLIGWWFKTRACASKTDTDFS